MRTTVTLEGDAQLIVQRLMRERGLTFKQAINEAIRSGARASARRRGFRTRTADLGEPAVSLDKALRVAADLEDEALVRRLEARK